MRLETLRPHKTSSRTARSGQDLNPGSPEYEGALPHRPRRSVMRLLKVY
jgi:hypothetical protein